MRGQVEALRHLAGDLDISLFAAGPLSPEDRAGAPLPLHAFPLLSERNLTRIWHRLDLPFPRVEWVSGGRIDLFHATDFVLAPVSARYKVLTVHDLAFVHHPEAAVPGLQHYLNTVVPRSVERADHLIADSHHTARDLQTLWGIEPDRISVVQGGVDHQRFRPLTDPAVLARVRARYGLGDAPFILGLSKIQPRKNFARLIRAFHLARQETHLPHRLVIAGSRGWLFEPVFAAVRELGLEDDVLFPGFIADEDLPALYNAASLFAYPSLYEGFGLPVLEALACGTPVLTGDNSCLPEAGGPGALYVQAESIESIADGLARLASDGELAASLTLAGREHAARFTWARSAQQLVAAYRSVLDR